MGRRKGPESGGRKGKSGKPHGGLSDLDAIVSSGALTLKTSPETAGFAPKDLRDLKRYGIIVGDVSQKDGVYVVELTQDGTSETYTPIEVREMAEKVRVELQEIERQARRMQEIEEVAQALISQDDRSVTPHNTKESDRASRAASSNEIERDVLVTKISELIAPLGLDDKKLNRLELRDRLNRENIYPETLALFREIGHPEATAKWDNRKRIAYVEEFVDGELRQYTHDEVIGMLRRYVKDSKRRTTTTTTLSQSSGGVVGDVPSWSPQVGAPLSADVIDRDLVDTTPEAADIEGNLPSGNADEPADANEPNPIVDEPKEKGRIILSDRFPEPLTDTPKIIVEEDFRKRPDSPGPIHSVSTLNTTSPYGAALERFGLSDEQFADEEFKIESFLKKFPHIFVKNMGFGKYHIEETRPDRKKHQVDLTRAELLRYIDQHIQLDTHAESYTEEIAGYEGLFAQFKALFPDAHITKQRFITFTSKFGVEMIGTAEDAMRLIIQHEHPGLSRSDEDSLLAAWEAEFQRGKVKELTLDVDGSRIELEKHLSRIRAQFPDAEISPDGKYVTMTVGIHKVTMEVGVALENAERKEREALEGLEKLSVEEIARRFMEYNDVTYPDEVRQQMNEQGKNLVEQTRKYSEAVKALFDTYSPQEVIALAERLRTECQGHMTRLGVVSSPSGNSLSWAMWDIGKQYHFFTHPEEQAQLDTEGKYRLANPMEDVEKQQEIMDRHLGWEVYVFMHTPTPERNAWLAKVVAEPSLVAVGEYVLEHAKHAKPDGQLHSHEYAELGRMLRNAEITSPPGGGEPPVPGVAGGEGGEPPFDPEEAKLRLEVVRRDLAELRKADSEVAYTTTKLIDKYAGLKAAYGGKQVLGAYRFGNDTAALMWVRNRIAELKEEEKRLEGGLGQSFDTRFNTKFGITKEDLAALPGYTRLTEGQRVLLYENLDDFAERGDGLGGAVWTGITLRFGIRGEAIPRKGTRGIAAYKAQLGLMIQGMQGVRVHVENGKAVPDFVGIELARKFRPEQKAVLDELNRQAHVFARMPASWQEDGNGIEQQSEWEVTKFLKNTVMRTRQRSRYNEYRTAYDRFESAKSRFAEVMEQTGHAQEDIVRALITVDANVHASRFIDTNPEVVALLKDSLSPQSAETLGSKVLSAGIYAGLGVVSRRALAECTGLVMGPVIAMAVEASKKWNEKAAQFREDHRRELLQSPDERRKQMSTPEYVQLRRRIVELSRTDPLGESKEYKQAVEALHALENKDTSLNIVNAQSTVTIEGKQYERGLSTKLERAVAEYLVSRDSDEVVRRGGYLNSNRVMVPEVVHTRRELALRHLRGIVKYAEDKLRLNRIHFGDAREYACNRARFLEAYTQAQILIATEQLAGESGGALVKRLEAYLARQESNIDTRRKKAQARAMIHRDVVAAGAFGLAGIGLQESGAVDVVVDKAKEGWSKLPEAWDGLKEKLSVAMEPNVPYRDTPIPYRDVDSWNQSAGQPPVPPPKETVPTPRTPDPVGLVAMSEGTSSPQPEGQGSETKPGTSPQTERTTLADPRTGAAETGRTAQTPSPTGAPLGPDAVRIAPGLEGGIPARDWEKVRGRRIDEVLRAIDRPGRRVIPGVNMNVLNSLSDIMRNEGVKELIAPRGDETVDQFMKRLTEKLGSTPPGWPLPPSLDELLQKYPFLKASLSGAYDGTLPGPVATGVEAIAPVRLPEIIPDIRAPREMAYVANHPGFGRMHIEFIEDMSNVEKTAGVKVNGEPLKIVKIDVHKAPNGVGSYTTYTLQGERATDTHTLIKPSMGERMEGQRIRYIKNGVTMELFRANSSNKMP